MGFNYAYDEVAQCISKFIKQTKISTKGEHCNVTSLSNIVLESLNTFKISDGVLIFKKKIQIVQRGKRPSYHAAGFDL